MTKTPLLEKRSDLTAKITDFAQEHVAGREDLYRRNVPPENFLKQMGKKGLLGIGVDQKYGGQSMDLPEISLVGNKFAEKGGCLGLSLSWLIHELISRLINRHGSVMQKETILPGLTKGEKTICFAVSEPDTGSHPKYLKTIAEKNGDTYTLNGEKIWVTNAPVADHFIIIAISAKKNDRKKYSAFLVTKETKGLTVTEPFDIPFFRPSAHGGIRLTDCTVHENMILGTPHNAYEDLVIPFSVIENSTMMGVVSGGMSSQYNLLTSRIKASKVTLSDEIFLQTGILQSLIFAATAIAEKAAQTSVSAEEKNNPDLLWIFFRKLCQDIQAKLKDIITLSGITPDETFDHITGDLISSSNLSLKTLKNKQIKLGKGVLSETNRV